MSLLTIFCRFYAKNFCILLNLHYLLPLVKVGFISKIKEKTKFSLCFAQFALPLYPNSK